MTVIDLQTAMELLTDAVRDNDAGQSPYFLIVGAGMAAGTIPLASEITRECQTLAQVRKNKPLEPAADDYMGQYSYWFDLAKPQPLQRQAYLKSLIEGKRISTANLQLAHLLTESQLTRLVVTPNFDDQLTRALTLFGRPFLVCDHPSTAPRVRTDSTSLQVIHVHGTYHHYDLVNLNYEILQRAGGISESLQTMANLVRQVLYTKVPIVLGYSGWENDVIMTQLKIRLLSGGPLPYLLLWFCFTRDDAKRLPAWLKEHPFVRIVAPDEESTDSVLGGKQSSMTAVNTLPASKILQELISARLELDEPSLFRDPLGFLVANLEAQLVKDEGLEGDPYKVAAVIQRLRRAIEWETSLQPAAEDQNEPILEIARGEVRRLRYHEAVGALQTLNVARMTEDQRTEAALLALTAGGGLWDEEELAAYDLAVNLVDANGGGIASTNREAFARALVNKGIRLGMLGRFQEAVQAYDDVIGRFGAFDELAVRVQVAWALNSKAVQLDALGRVPEAIAAYDEVVRRFGNASEPELAEQVATALLCKGDDLGYVLGRLVDATAAYDEVVRRFAGSTMPGLSDNVALALGNKGDLLGQDGKFEDAETALRASLNVQQNATTEMDLATVLVLLGKQEEAAAFVQQVLGAPVSETTAHGLATYFTTIGDHDEAWQWLERGCVSGFVRNMARRNPHLAALRKLDEPRFVSLTSEKLQD